MRLKNYLRKSVDNISNNNNLNKFLKFLKINTVILNYHRVLNDNEFNEEIRPDDNLVLSKSIFEKQISFIKENFTPISINKISEQTDYKKKRIVITFDDGYLDNLVNALPILKKYECPAIIYITTSFLDNKNDAWWFKIWELILNNDEITYKKNKFDTSNLEKKRKSYSFFCKKIFLMKKKDQKIFFDDLIFANKTKTFEKKLLFLSSDNLKYLNKEDLIEIGCHTHYHQNLNILNEEETTNEIKISKDILEKILQRKINHFSIPFGTKKTYSNKTINIIASHGFKTNVTTNYDLFKKDNILKIPRIGIGNDDVGSRLNSKLIGLNSLINKLFR